MLKEVVTNEVIGKEPVILKMSMTNYYVVVDLEMGEARTIVCDENTIKDRCNLPVMARAHQAPIDCTVLTSLHKMFSGNVCALIWGTVGDVEHYATPALYTDRKSVV